ncbi:S8 family serine peptidase [Streptomyces lichenis]|uniref:S8 family serine peptidase n=1 Tax=Streptomyces lichenis TaxID=2306967 RepID=A0ABT0IGF3_9ACTN|nr:S8 family serine peptidase [Streptomyces lichenis]MCK8680405.1 S8 family serine peptidase [Streptomyces lichenis]
MHVDTLWKQTRGKGVTVAVVDTGVNPSTSSLQGQVLPGKDLTGVAGEETDDYDGHGTTVAELIAGTGRGGGLRGLAPDTKIIPFRVSNTQLQDKGGVNARDMEQAIRAAANSEAKIINVSMSSDYYGSSQRDAVEYAQSKGKLVFAGSGNGAQEGNKEQYPAAYPEAVAVAATNAEGRVADFSTHGSYVDISAPGTDIPFWCDENFTQYCESEGTSASTALASATAALIWSKHPEWTGNQVLRVMFESAGRNAKWKPGQVSHYTGHGVVRPNAHITRGLGKPGDPDVSPDTGKRVGGKPGSTPKPPAPSDQGPEATASGDSPALAGSAGKADDSGSGTSSAYLIGGGIAAAAVLAGAGALVARRRQA